MKVVQAVKNRELQNARRSLDKRLDRLKPVGSFKAPPKGWSKAIRMALGMTGSQFAKRLGVSQQSAVALERSEANGKIQIETLRRAAEALDCTLVYALVPKTSLEQNINDRARKRALEHLARVSHTMKLEAQETGESELEERIQDYIQNDLTEREVWKEP
jgi:predicted DNA-binding mobile mystery protein A